MFVKYARDYDDLSKVRKTSGPKTSGSSGPLLPAAVLLCPTARAQGLVLFGAERAAHKDTDPFH